ncbi:unnamed protein product [Jaminaea pallidilutea]
MWLLSSARSSLQRVRTGSLPAYGLIVPAAPFSLRTAARSSKMTAQEAFGDASFNVERYLSNRPRYPDHLYRLLRDYYRPSVQGRSKDAVLLDLGCGPGFAAFPLLNDFPGGLIGVDTSKGMVQAAPSALQSWLASTSTDASAAVPLAFDVSKASFVVSNSNDLKGVVSDDSVDVVIAATAAHWFEYGPTWREMSRVVRPGGSVLWFTYGEHYMRDHPSLQRDIFEFMQGDAQGSIGPYFPQPGRSLLTNLLKDVPFPNEIGGSHDLPDEMLKQWDLASAVRHMHPMASDGHPDLSWLEQQRQQSSNATQQNEQSDEQPFRLEQRWTWAQYESYIRTSSALHNYLKNHPQEQRQQQQQQQQQGGGDVASRFVERIRSKVLQQRRKGEAVSSSVERLSDDEVRIAWPLGLMAICKKVHSP